ncbi:hypothetical protein NRB56_02780 [Nocardia sp. RB56]|uniref:Uncharacterized protein n=1 Tax=Nocardia aurantia TaxID=2585199 RepID=A0A7K0DFZ4_9NOCA|nr:hypothetical protein [Nocardia aurantia]
MTYLGMLTLLNISRTLGYALLGLHGLSMGGTL